jgi:drug/metabolite transporter (DMT)-like permease
MPIFGAVLSAVFLREPLFSYHYIGALLVFSGLFIVTGSRGSKAPERPAR